MKLRCVQDSIRLRLRKSELEQLKQQGKISESVGFPGGKRLFYHLEVTKDEFWLVRYEEDGIRVGIPKNIARQWITTNQVSLETEMDLETANRLHILIEKDFPCKDREDEDKSDTFQELAEQADKGTC